MGSIFNITFLTLLLANSTLAAPVFPNFGERNLTFSEVPICEDLPIGQAINGSFCFEPILAHAPTSSLKIEGQIQPRFVPTRSDLEIDSTNGSKRWCARPSRAAAQPRKVDAQKLCHNLPDIITIAPNTAINTHYKNMALCQIFDEGTARYRACNLDTCNSQIFERNKQNCFELYHKCPEQGESGGYRVGLNPKGQGFATTMTGTRMMGDYPFEHNDDAFLMEQFQLTCA